MTMWRFITDMCREETAMPGGELHLAYTKGYKLDSKKRLLLFLSTVYNKIKNVEGL